VNLLTSASGSEPQGNTKKDRIQQTQSRAKKNKLEDHPRTVRPSFHNKNSVVNTKSISFIPNSKLNVNSDLKCATITTTAIVPLKKPIPIESNTSKPVVTLVYSWKSKEAKNTVPVSKSKINKSLVANKKEPNNSWGSTISNVPSSTIECRLSKLFSGQFCVLDLEVAFRQHTCFIRNLDGVDLLTGSRGNSLYTLSLKDMMASSPICLLFKASKTKSWLWHHRLLHLNFGTINHLARQGLVRESVNGKNYILVIVDDYSRFTWVKCLRSKDEAPYFIIKFLKMIQVGISHETSVARSPQQNGVVERRNVCPLTRITTTAIVPFRNPVLIESNASKPVVTLVVQIVLWYLDSECSKHMTEDRSQLINFVQKFLGTVKFENDHVAKIMGYGDYKIGNVTISRVYFVEGLGHNLFSMG
nr:integrase, catalytic region, zinc finger, CCHC-type, peptidase aspartic, catalytic [Tanacetum cinerariifolium]